MRVTNEQLKELVQQCVKSDKNWLFATKPSNRLFQNIFQMTLSRRNISEKGWTVFHVLPNFSLFALAKNEVKLERLLYDFGLHAEYTLDELERREDPIIYISETERFTNSAAEFHGAQQGLKTVVADFLA